MKETLNFDERFPVMKANGGENDSVLRYDEFGKNGQSAIKSYIRELLESLRKENYIDNLNGYSPIAYETGYNKRNELLNSKIDTILKNL